MFFEYADKLLANDFSLALRVSYASQLAQKSLFSVNIDEFNLKMILESPTHLLGLIESQQAVVHKYTRELIADRLMHECGNATGVYPPADSADHLV